MSRNFETQILWGGPDSNNVNITFIHQERIVWKWLNLIFNHNLEPVIKVNATHNIGEDRMYYPRYIV